MDDKSEQISPSQWKRLIPALAVGLVLLLFAGDFLLRRFPPIPIAGGLILGTIVGSFVLCAVVGAYNNQFKRNAVPELPLGKSMIVVICSSLINLSLAAAVPLLADAINVRESEAWKVARILPFPLLSMIVLGLALKILLPTTFKRGILISLFFTLTWVVIAAIVAGVWYAMDGDFRF